MKVLDSDEMRRVDRAASETLGVPSMVVMENAAIGVADAIGERFSAARSVAIFCGPGNNGGDGYALARHLAGRGYEIRLFAVGPRPKPDSDAGRQLEIVRRMGLEAVAVSSAEEVASALDSSRLADLVVDALFGTGLSRALEEPYAGLVQALAAFSVPRLAIDLPSGLDASRSDLRGPHFRADLTVTFAAPKVALVLPPACEEAGELVIADLGIPADLVEESGARLNLLVAEELAAYMPPRQADSHKGDYGHALLVAGSPGKAGAAILAARAAVRSGAGLVTAAVPETLLQTVDRGSLESMTLPLPDGGPRGLGEAAAAALVAATAGKTAAAIGPGLGTEPGTFEVARGFALGLPLPLVIDADGLNAFEGALQRLRERSSPTILTPHPGEMGRLLGRPTSEVTADRLGAAREAARRSGAIVVLKGYRSLIATPDGEVWINPTGNPGMATGGTGDVLTGMLLGLLAQGLEPLTAAQVGVFAHGLAGDLVARRAGERGLRASDLIEELPAAWRALAES
jgi:NAD(P)H-hydrate epimerase